MGEEIWKPVVGYEGRYEVSNLGRVRSLRFGKNKILSPGKLRYGHSVVVLSKDGMVKGEYVHRLVAFSFLPNIENKPCVLHKEETLVEGRLYNGVDNLWWGTMKDNSMDRNKKGRGYCFFAGKPSMWKGVTLGEHFASKKIVQLSKTGELIKEFSCIKEASIELNLHQGNVSECCNKKRKSVGGFKFAFK